MCTYKNKMKIKHKYHTDGTVPKPIRKIRRNGGKIDKHTNTNEGE